MAFTSILETLWDYFHETTFLKEVDTLHLVKQMRSVQTEEEYLTLLRSYKISWQEHAWDYLKTIGLVLLLKKHRVFLSVKIPSYQINKLKRDVPQISKHLNPAIRYHLLTTQFFYQK